MDSQLRARLYPFILLTSLSIAGPAVAQMEIATGEPEPLEAEMVARSESGSAEPMPLISERVSVVIDNQHATTTVKQTYHNKTGGVLEGRYTLKAGSGTRVGGFAYWNGEQKIVGEVFEKEVARQIYESVTRRRRDPGLLEETSDGGFSFQVFPISANEKKRIEVRYSKWLKRQGKSIRYRAPVAHRGAGIVIDIRSKYKVKNVRSSSHSVTVDALRGGGARIRAKGRGKGKTFELSYELAQPAWDVNALVHKDPKHDGYFAVALAAPTNLERKVSAKDVTIVLDRSGSMSGEPLRQATAAAANIIRRLDSDDRLNVVLFDDDVDPLFDEPLAVSAKNRARAIEYVEGIEAGGGTDLALALRTSFKAQSATKRPQVILFLTDGKSDAERAIEAAKKDKRDVRVFAVGLGEGVNKALLSRLARIKRGQSAYIENATDIERNIGLVYKQISRPLLIDVSFDVVGASTERRVYPRTIPDLFIDDELLISGRLRGESGPITFVIRGQLDGKPVEYRKRVNLARSSSRPWVGRLWAQARVGHLLEDLELDGEQAEKKTEVIELALAYNFVTKFTSFLAIPEGEATGNTKAALDNARARKAEVLRKHKDAVALKEKNQRGRRERERDVDRAAPQGAPPPRVAERQLSMDSRGDGDDDDDDADEDDGDPSHPGSARKKSGCAGCQAPGTGDGGALILLVLAGLLIRRRRCSRR